MRVRRFASLMLILGALAAPVITVVPPVHAGARFFAALPDVPIAQSFSEITDSVVIFDKAEGRLIDVSARGEGLEACLAALPFYQKTLPALGWQNEGQKYKRSGEVLTLDLVEMDDGSCLLSFQLRPENH